MLGKQPIRTYQRKTRKPLISTIPLVPVLQIERYNFNESTSFGESITTKNCHDSMNCDPFETTFDRVAKGAVVPPLPPDIYQDTTWDSSDSYIKNVTNPIKSPKNIAFNSSPCKSTFDLSHENIVPPRECRRPQKYKAELTLTRETFPKKTKLISTREKAQSKKKEQRWKKKTSKEEKTTIHKFKKSSRKCNKETSHSYTTSNLKDVTHKDDVSRDYDNKHLRQSALKTDESIIVKSQTVPNQTNNCIVTSKYPSDYHQSIKPCFVELDVHAVQNWRTQNLGRSMRNKQKHTLCNIKLSSPDASQINDNATKVHKTIPQLSSIDRNVETFKDISMEPCSTKLYDSIIKKWNISENKENTKDYTDEDKPVLSYRASHNLSKIASHTNPNIVISNTEKDKKNLTRDFVKLERLDVKDVENEKCTVLNRREQHIISSTPIRKPVRPSICRVLLSPIDTCYVLNVRDKASTINPGESISIELSNERLERKNSTRSLNTSKHCKMNVINTQEDQTQILLDSQVSPTTTVDSAVKIETILSNEDIHAVVTHKYDTYYDVERHLSRSLNISEGTDQSRSLFSDSHNHLADNVESNTKQDLLQAQGNLTGMLQHKSAEADITVLSNLPINLDLKEKYSLNNNAHIDTNSTYASSSETKCAPPERELLENLNNIDTKRVCKSERKQSTEIDIAEMVCENSKNKSLDDSKQDSYRSQNNIDVKVLLTKLEDPIRITKRRTQYSKWHLNMSNIPESFRNESINLNNKVTPYVAIDKYSNILLTENNTEYSENATNSFHNYLNSPNVITQQCSNDTYMQVEKSVFLKPGKCWTRSLSILNNINARSDLDKLSIGKGKKWRHSVKDILDMQKQGICRSCSKVEEDDTDLSCQSNVSNVSTIDDNKFKTLDSTSNTRFSKRISVRVVPNNTNINYNVEDTLFLEVFDITTENSSRSKVLQQKESPICDVRHSNDNQIFENNLKTAKDIVLQRCSQKCFLPFSECFPDTYLEHCRKIGEGVYGEVFLYEYNDIKSVIKIIPIEGEELVNGEPQKKFNEILSEIVISKELHNLRLHPTYKTSGFVEVRSIKCIVGKYPEKLVELWNIYDDNKTSDNDCPSMFGENQLYIALELSHGGEDLEAFVFQTAQEACALFLQTALALAVAEKALEFEHRDLHWGNVLISRTKESHVYYNLAGKEITFPTNGVKVSIIDFTLSRMSYHECCIYNDLALDPALFTAHGEYQFEIYRLMRDKIQNNWRKFEPYTNILWLHYTLDKMITAVRYKKKNLKAHKHAITKLKEFKNIILNYDSAFDFISNSDSIVS